MKELITRAIAERHLVRLVYERKRLTVEPHVLGQTQEGHDALLAWQVTPPLACGTPWCLVRLDRIMELQVLDRPFESSAGARSPQTEEFSLVEARA